MQRKLRVKIYKNEDKGYICWQLHCKTLLLLPFLLMLELIVLLLQ